MGDENPTTTNSDKELDDLLDSALEDLTKKPEASGTNSVVESSQGSENLVESIDDVKWTEEFIKEAASQFESSMSSLLSSDELNSSIRKMAEAAAQIVSNPTENITPQSDAFATTISETLRGLSEGAENIQNPFSEQELANMLGSLNVEGDDTPGNSFLPFMQSMMQNLLSKEVLYPSLKDIIEKYPAWLEANKSKISSEDFERYTKQKDLMSLVCGELENESKTDSTDVKKVRFDKVLGLLQQIQDLGQPPSDLVGDVSTPGLPFDSTNLLPNLPTDPNQCSLM